MDTCKLCSSYKDLTSYEVSPDWQEITICGTCNDSIKNPIMNQKHWNCLHDSMWSTEPAVQAIAYRLLTKLNAQDQLDMLYLEDDIKTIAMQGMVEQNAQPVLDANGSKLEAGDSVSIIKDLPVKGAGFTAKQGTTVKNIRITSDDHTHIQGRVNGSMIFIISAFVKKL